MHLRVARRSAPHGSESVSIIFSSSYAHDVRCARIDSVDGWLAGELLWILNNLREDVRDEEDKEERRRHQQEGVIEAA